MESPVTIKEAKRKNKITIFSSIESHYVEPFPGNLMLFSKIRKLSFLLLFMRSMFKLTTHPFATIACNKFHYVYKLHCVLQMCFRATYGKTTQTDFVTHSDLVSIDSFKTINHMEFVRTTTLHQNIYTATKDTGCIAFGVYDL